MSEDNNADELSTSRNETEEPVYPKPVDSSDRSNDEMHHRGEEQLAEHISTISLHQESSKYHSDYNPEGRSSLIAAVIGNGATGAPQRSVSGSSTESTSSTDSDKQLKKDLESATSDSEKMTIYRRHSRNLRRKVRKLLEKQNALEKQLQDAKNELEKVNRFQYADAYQMSSSEHTKDVKIRNLEAKVSALQEALRFTMKGDDIPDSLHLHLVHLGCSTVSDLVDDSSLDLESSDQDASPRSLDLSRQGSLAVKAGVEYEELMFQTGCYNNYYYQPHCNEATSLPDFRPPSLLTKHAFYNLLVTNLIQTLGTKCLGCDQKISRSNSHPYGKCILLSAAAFALKKPKDDVKKMRLFCREDLCWRGPASDTKCPKYAVTAEVCTYPVKREALCEKCDNSSSAWENELHVQFTRPTIEYKGSDITKPILLVQMFRAGILSIEIQHYMSCQKCNKYLSDVGDIMLALKDFHEAVCAKRQDDAIEHCKQLKPVVFHNTELGGTILYPVVVNMRGLVLLFAQIPPYYWAVPSTSCEVELTELMVADVAGVCRQKERCEFAKTSREALPNAVLIFPVFDSCCIEF